MQVNASETEEDESSVVGNDDAVVPGATEGRMNMIRCDKIEYSYTDQWGSFKAQQKSAILFSCRVVNVAVTTVEGDRADCSGKKKVAF